MWYAAVYAGVVLVIAAGAGWLKMAREKRRLKHGH